MEREREGGREGEGERKREIIMETSLHNYYSVWIEVTMAWVMV